MDVQKTSFDDVLIITPSIFNDQRGYFMESYNFNVFSKHGIDHNFIQDNQSKSSFGVIRGLHFQNPPHDQTKLIRVLSGKILDVIVDIRKSSKNYGKAFTIELSAKNKKQLLVPKGFAHGFSVLSESAEIIYKSDNFYNKSHEGGLLYNDPAFRIDWQVPDDKAILSEKDLKYPTFDKFNSHFE